MVEGPRSGAPLAGARGVWLLSDADALLDMRCCYRGYVQVWNGDTGPPNTSLNQIVPGAVVNDSIYVKVAANGRVYILSTVATDVIIEIHEWGGS